jgi:hypothetical protein
MNERLLYVRLLESGVKIYKSTERGLSLFIIVLPCSLAYSIITLIVLYQKIPPKEYKRTFYLCMLRVGAH